MFIAHEPDDYEVTFGDRGHLYHRANARLPAVRERERAALIERLAPITARPDAVVCDVPAGGGYVADGIAARHGDRVHVICIEPSPAFAAFIDPRFETRVGPLERFDLPAAHVDGVASLAALHHVEDKAAFMREAFRVLRPGGVVVVADVLAGTPVARFLNDAVDRLSTTGHRGLFVAPGDFTRDLAAAGFVDIREEHLAVPWPFPDVPAELAYVRDLFGLVGADDDSVAHELRAAFGDSPFAAPPIIPWALTYATASKEPRRTGPPAAARRR